MLVRDLVSGVKIILQLGSYPFTSAGWLARGGSVESASPSPPVHGPASELNRIIRATRPASAWIAHHNGQLIYGAKKFISFGGVNYTGEKVRAGGRGVNHLSARP